MKRFILLSAATVCTAILLPAEMEFEWLGYVNFNIFLSEAQAVSADGSIVVGDAYNFAPTIFYWKNGVTLDAEINFWEVGEDRVDLLSSYATGVNADGSRVIGYAALDGGGTAAIHWTPSMDPVQGQPPGTTVRLDGASGEWLYSTARGINDDGSMIVGSGRKDTDAAFVWTEETGMVVMSPDSSNAVDISGDGNVIVGEVILTGSPLTLQAISWVNGGPSTPLGDFYDPVTETTFTSTSAQAVSRNGQFIVGDAWSTEVIPYPRRAFLWAADEGYRPLQELSDTTKRYSRGHGVSNDGNVIVGIAQDDIRNNVAVVWDGAGNIRKLGDLVNDKLPGTLNEFEWLSNAHDVTPDGSVIVGLGYWVQDSFAKGWRAFRITGYDGFSPDAGGLWSDALDLGDGWLQSSWFGTFNATDLPTIYHTEHGFQDHYGGPNNTIYIFDYLLNAWFQTGMEYYPFIFKISAEAGWYYYREGGSPGNRMFLQVATETWLHESEI